MNGLQSSAKFGNADLLTFDANQSCLLISVTYLLSWVPPVEAKGWIVSKSGQPIVANVRSISERNSRYSDFAIREYCIPGPDDSPSWEQIAHQVRLLTKMYETAPNLRSIDVLLLCPWLCLMPHTIGNRHIMRDKSNTDMKRQSQYEENNFSKTCKIKSVSSARNLMTSWCALILAPPGHNSKFRAEFCWRGYCLEGFSEIMSS